jgi:hypothetical protein
MTLPSTPLFSPDVLKSFEYPKYEVLLPGFKQQKTVLVTSLLIKDEMELSSISTVTEHKWFEEICKLAFNKIVDGRKELFPLGYDQFLEMCSIEDRDALLLGIIHATYGNDLSITFNCNSCSTPNELKLPLSECVQVTLPKIPEGVEKYTDVTASFEMDVPFHVKATLKVPSLIEYKRCLEYVDKVYSSESKRRGFMASIFPMLSCLQSLELQGTDLNIPSIQLSKNNMIDLVSHLLSMPKNFKKTFISKIREINPEDVGIKLQMKFTCRECGTLNDVSLTVVDLFFQMILS